MLLADAPELLLPGVDLAADLVLSLPLRVVHGPNRCLVDNLWDEQSIVVAALTDLVAAAGRVEGEVRGVEAGLEVFVLGIQMAEDRDRVRADLKVDVASGNRHWKKKKQ